MGKQSRGSEHAAAWLHQAHAWKHLGLTREAAQAYRRAPVALFLSGRISISALGPPYTD